jgi:hypothetical protein
MSKSPFVCVTACTMFLVCLLVWAAPGPAVADTFQYAAKYLCTAEIPGTSQTTPSVLPGIYQTAVNIHNPHSKIVQLRQKIAAAVPGGIVSEFITGTLNPDHAMSVSCDQIATGFGLTFIHGSEGFLVIESPDSLDVTAVYTAGPRGGEVASMAVEQIRERRLNNKD